MNSPTDPAIWQSVQIYKEEAINPENPFTEEQRNELLKIAENAEEKSKGINNLKKFGLLLAEYDSKFQEYGGDMDRLEYKIDVIYNEVNKSLHIDRLISISEQMAGAPGKIKRVISRRCGSDRR